MTSVLPDGIYPADGGFVVVHDAKVVHDGPMVARFRTRDEAERFYAAASAPTTESGLPPEVQAAADLLAEWGSARARASHPEYENHDALRDYMVGAVLAQVEDPDYEAAAEMAAYDPTEGTDR